MSIVDRIAKRLVVAHTRVLNNKNANGWFTSIRQSVEDDEVQTIESASVKVKFASGASLKCEIAADDQSKTVGLQKYASLPHGYGMIFPFDNETVKFHMGTVPFPIDIIFVGADNRVSRIDKYVEPGTRAKFGMSHVSAVIEANAGFCDENGIDVGCSVETGIDKSAQMDFGDVRKDVNPKMLPPSGIDPEDRFRDRDLITMQMGDLVADPAHFDQTMGYDPSKDMSDTVGPMRPAATKKSK